MTKIFSSCVLRWCAPTSSRGEAHCLVDSNAKRNAEARPAVSWLSGFQFAMSLLRRKNVPTSSCANGHGFQCGRKKNAPTRSIVVFVRNLYQIRSIEPTPVQDRCRILRLTYSFKISTFNSFAATQCANCETGSCVGNK